MENTRRRRRRGLPRTITAVFAVAFVASIISTITAFAAANLFKIQNAELSELSTTAEGNISSFDETNIVSNVTFHKLNDSAKYTITLKNTDSKDHVIESITDDNENPCVSYEYDQHANEQIDAGENLIFIVTAKYSTAITDVNQRAQANNVKFFIHFTDLEEEIPIVPNTGTNPNTSDHIHFSVLSLVISAAGLTIIGIIALKKHKKASKFIAAGIVAAAAIAITATVKAVTMTVNSFTLTSNYGFFDKLVVTYTDKDGNDQELIVNYNEPANIPDQSKDGYTLTGWEDEQGNPVDPTQPITEDVKIHPIYRTHTYTIKFNGNGTNGEMADIAMAYDETKTLPANAFNFQGRTYAGWDTEANGSGIHYDDQAEVKNLTAEDNGIVTLYAQWSINPFHIDYDGNGATSGEMATTNCEYDQACQLRDNAFEKYGYDFAGWKYNDTIYADKADVTNIIDHGTITMVAQWTPHIYTITYTGLTSEEAAALRTAGNPDTYTIESPSFTLKNPEDRKDADGDTRERFVGWVEVVEPSTSVTLPMVGNLGDKTFNAVWETVALPEYDITYNYDGGNVATANPTKLNKEQGATLNEPEKTGYTFTGWTGTTISGDTPVKLYTIPAPHQKGNLEYTAHYRAHTYTVNFDINTDDTHVSGTMQPLVLNYDEEKALTVNAFTRTGYTFAGWKDADNTEYTDGQNVKNLTAEDGATVTLKAQWTPTEYTIIFHANNDNVENPDVMTPQVIIYDVDTELNANQYTWYQHKIVEWTTNADGTGTKYADKASVKNLSADGGEIHLYAKWREIDAALDGRGYGTNKNITTKLKAIKTNNPDIKNFLHYPDGEPSEEIKAGATDISGTIDPIYIWVDGDNLYWWSEDVKPRLSTNQSLEYFFYGVEIDNVDLTGFDSTGITYPRSVFEYARIKKVDISDWDMSKATDMGYFAYSSRLEEIIFPEHFDVQKVTNLGMAFSSAKLKKLNLSGWKTRDLRSLGSFIQGMSTLTEVTFGGDFKTDNVISMAAMINANPNLTTINNLDMLNTANVTNMSSMFAGDKSLTSLDLSGFNTSSLTNINNMFQGMTALSSLTLGGGFTAENVTTMDYAFIDDTNLETLDLSNLTSKPTTITDAFRTMSNLKTIDISNMDLSDVAQIGQLFLSDSKLETIYTSSSIDIEKITDDNSNVFYSNSNLVGGAGTARNGNASTAVMARIDDPDNGKPGYFTIKGARYVRYHDNDGDDTNDEANYALMTSHYLKAGEHLKTNTFTRDGYTFNGWKDADNNEYTDEQVMTGLTESKTPLELYAQWKEKSSTLQSGTIINQIMHDLNADATSFRKFPGTPTATTLENAQRISVSGSNYPAYMWNDGDTLYWWSEAEKVYLSDGDSFFYNMKKLETIDVAGLDTSKVKRMTQMFMNCYALTSLDLSTFNTSAVINMANMFSNDTALTSLNVTSFDTSKVGQMNGIFQGFAGEVLDLSSFDTSSVGGNVIAFFSTTNNLKTVYVGDKWNATNVDIQSTTPLVGGAGSTNGGARLDDPDNNSRGRLSKKDARYIRYHDNDGDDTNDETNYALMTSEYLKAGDSLTKNAFTRNGYEFAGWKDADDNDYTDEQVMTDLAESKTPLELYAQWDAKSYTVTFDANGGEMLQSAKTVTYQQPYGELPTPVKYDYANSILGGKYSFKEWNTKADGSGDTVASSSIYANADDTTLYAIWNDQFTVTIYNGESETPTTASYGVDDMIDLHAQNVTGKQFLYWEVDGAKKSYIKDCSMHMFQGKDLTIRAIYGSESDLKSQQPGTYISDIYRQYNDNKVVVRSYSYVPNGYKIVKAGVIATLDANIANSTFDDQTATYVRPENDNGNSDIYNYYFTWSKSSVTSEQTVYVKAYLKYKDADDVEHTIYGDLVTATLTE